HDVEAAEEGGGVQGAADLAGPAADAVDDLTLENFGRDLEAVVEGAGADDVVEGEHLAWHQGGAVQLLGGAGDVLRAGGLAALIGEAGLVPGDDGAGVDREHGGAGRERVLEVGSELDGGLAAGEGAGDGLGGGV